MKKESFSIPLANMNCSKWFLYLTCIFIILIFNNAVAQIILSQKPIWEAVNSYPTGIGWADIDGNGWHDLIVTNGLDVTNSPNVIYFNDGGKLNELPGWTSEDRLPSDCIYIGDFDNDSDPDLAVASLGLTGAGLPPLPHVVYFNNAGLSAAPGWQTPLGNAFSCAGGDYDGDGDIDLVFGQGDWLTRHLQKSVLYINNGGVFHSTPGWETANPYYVDEVVFADIDNDGDLDLALGNERTVNNVAIAVFYNQNGILESSPSWFTNKIVGGRQMAFGDVDGDGYLDLAVAGPTQDFFLFKNINGTLETTPSWSSGSHQEPSAVAWADVDRDGDLDLAACSWFSLVGIFENINGTLADTFAWSYGKGNGYQQLAWADFDEDGLIDTTRSFSADGKRKLFYLGQKNIHKISGIQINGSLLDLKKYCYDLGEGWVSLADAPPSGSALVIHYTYSNDLDLAVTDYSKVRVFENLVCALEFSADPKSGHAPLAVKFDNSSQAVVPITSWAWDFDSDGNIDSDERDPSWIYNQPGIYSVSLEVICGSQTYKLVMENYIQVFDGESALLFDGKNSLVRCAASPTLNLTENLTIEAWINPTGWGENQTIGFGKIIDKFRCSLLLINTSTVYNSHSLTFQMSHANGTTSFSMTPVNSIVLDNWQHVALTYCAAKNEMRMYINGTEQTVSFTKPPSGSIADNSANDLIIGNNAGQSMTFVGAIDEVRLWNVVRTSAELQGAMNYCFAKPQPGLIGCWGMNEGNGAAIADISDYEHPGIIIDAKWCQGKALTPTSVLQSQQAQLNTKFVLYDNYPNPFNPVTTIRFDLPNSSAVQLMIYDLTGRLIKNLACGNFTQGTHQIKWNGTNNENEQVSSGIYIYKLATGISSQSKKMLLLK